METAARGRPLTAPAVRARKGGEPLVMVTAYDAWTARLVARSRVELRQEGHRTLHRRDVLPVEERHEAVQPDLVGHVVINPDRALVAAPLALPPMAALLALLSSLVWGTADFLGGTLSRRRPAVAVLGGSQPFGLLAALASAVVLGQLQVDASALVNGAIAGVFGLAGLVAFYTALSTGRMGIVSPISSLGVVIPLGIGLLLGEAPHPIQMMGVLVAVVGVVLASGPELTGAESARPVVLAGLSAVALGAALALIAALAISIVTGLRGIDFGYHWDEPRITDSVVDAYRTGVFLPRWYSYPSLSFDVAMATAAPDAVAAARAAPPQTADSGSIKDVIANAIDKTRLLLRLRVVFLVLTLLAAVWAFLAARQLLASPLEAALASLLLLSSWEIAYHARWVAPDGLMMSAAAFAILLMARSLNAPNPKWWLRAAAVAVGICTAAKYPGGILLPFLLYVVFCRRDTVTGRNAYIEAIVIAGATFLLLTPGAIAEPMHFIRDIRGEIIHYKIHGHGVNNVASFAEHMRLLGEYLGLLAFSTYPAFALIVASLALIGAAHFARTQPRAASISSSTAAASLAGSNMNHSFWNCLKRSEKMWPAR